MKNKPLKMIVAATARGEIGYQNTLPWRLKGDLRRFKEITLGNIVVMGRNTYESLPGPLEGRVVIVISSALARTSEIGGAVHFVRTLDDALKLARFLPGEKVLIAGGVRLYEEAMKMPITLHLTLVHKASANGYDAVIPNFNLNDFILNPSASLSFTPFTVFDTDPDTNVLVPSHTYLTYTSKLLPVTD